MSKRKDMFLIEVTNHIRSKEAKKFVASELEYHLDEVKKEWIGRGLSDAEAEEKAVAQMGSPTKLGHEFNKLHKPRVDWWLITLLLITMAMSFLPLITLGDSIDESYLLKKMVHVILGVLISIGLMFIDYRKFEKHGWTFYLAGVLLLFFLIKFPNIMINGVPYFKIGPLDIGSFISLPFMFLAWTSFFNNHKIKLWQYFLLFILPLMLLMAVPNMSAVFMYLAMVFIMMWWSRITRKTATNITIGSGVGAIVFGAIAWFSAKEYQLARILGFLNPEKYPDNWGFMYLQLKERLSSAGWFGSAEKSEALPFEHTDHVFVNLTYHFGYFFGIALFMILALFAARIFVISSQLKTRFGNLLLVGGVVLYLFQFIYNVGMMVGLLPITSISLPFISYGLMPMIFNAFIMGVVLSVYRRKDFTLDRA